FPRREEIAGGAARVGGAGQHGGRDRAQSGSNQNRGLGDRPRPRTRRRRRRNRRLGPAGGHRQGAAELYGEVSGAGTGEGGEAAEERSERGGGVKINRQSVGTIERWTSYCRMKWTSFNYSYGWSDYIYLFDGW